MHYVYRAQNSTLQDAAAESLAMTACRQTLSLYFNKQKQLLERARVYAVLLAIF
jgi:hypothetical protein